MAVGHLEARKNFLLLLDAVALLRNAGKRWPLLLVGNDGGGSPHGSPNWG